MMLKDLKIGSRLNLAFAIILFFMLTLTGIGIYELRSFAKAGKGISLADEVRDQMQKIDHALITMLLINDEGTRNEQKKAYDAGKANFRKALENIERIVSDNELKNTIGELKKQSAVIEKANDQIVDYCFSDMLEIGMNTFLANRTAGENVLKTCDKIVGAYERQVDDIALRAQIFFIAIGAIALVFGVIVSGVLRKSIVTPINRGVEIASKLADGDLSMRVDADGKDEVNYLLSVMGSTVEKLRAVMIEIKNASDNIASASLRLTSNSTEITDGMSQQSSRASQIATSSEEMSQTVMDIAKNASNIAESSHQTGVIAQNGSEIVGKSVLEVKAIAETVNSATEKMGSLSDRSKQIGEIVNVINDIADQTNLLALNAAIEAARAGEMGRGFAVVADEVRKLAERTAGATLEISEMIRSIQNEIDTTVESMGSVRKRVDHGVELSLQAGKELTEIVGSIGRLQSMVQQIASSTEEMSSTSELISKDIDGVANSAKDITSGSGRITESVSGLSELAAKMKGIVDMFKI